MFQNNFANRSDYKFPGNLTNNNLNERRGKRESEGERQGACRNQSFKQKSF